MRYSCCTMSLDLGARGNRLSTPAFPHLYFLCLHASGTVFITNNLLRCPPSPAQWYKLFSWRGLRLIVCLHSCVLLVRSKMFQTNISSDLSRARHAGQVPETPAAAAAAVLRERYIWRYYYLKRKYTTI